MKNLLLRLTFFLLFFSLVTAATCQETNETTIILVRHAEKDTVGGNDPSLSALGKERADRLQVALKEYKPDFFYSSNFKRTKETAKPWATQLDKPVKTYDPNNQYQFAELLKLQTGKTIVVVGHSNTVPALLNLLTAGNEYKQLPDSEYKKIFVVTVKKDGTATVKVREY